MMVDSVVERPQTVLKNLRDLEHDFGLAGQAEVFEHDDAIRRAVPGADLGIAVGPSQPAAVDAVAQLDADQGAPRPLHASDRKERGLALLERHRYSSLKTEE